MSAGELHVTTAQCAPLCSSVGHTFLTLSVWRCDHHGALTGVLSTYTEAADGLVNRVDTDWLSGPFTADLDVSRLLELVTAALHGLLDA